MPVERLRDLDIETSAALDSRVVIVKDNATEKEVTVALSDFVASLLGASNPIEREANYCYNPEGRIQQFRGEGDPDAASLGKIIDTSASRNKSLWFCDGWAVEAIGFEGISELVIGHSVVDSKVGYRNHKLNLTVDSLGSGVPSSDNLLKRSFMLDADERKELRGGFTVSGTIEMPYAGTYTFYVKTPFTVYVQALVVTDADTEQSFEITVPENTYTRTAGQNTFMTDRMDGIEIGFVLAGTKGALDTQNISETAADGYQTTSADEVLDYFINSSQVSAIAALDSYNITELRITQQPISYKGYNYDYALLRSQRYFQKSHIQALPAQARYIIFDDVDDGTPSSNNLSGFSFRDYFAGCLIYEQGDARNPYTQISKAPVVLQNVLKTHSNRSLVFGVNPVAVNVSAELATLADRSVSGLYMFTVELGARDYNLTSNPVPTYLLAQIPPDGEALDLSGHPAGTKNAGFIPGWLSGNTNGEVTGSSSHPSSLGPEINVVKNAHLSQNNQLLKTLWGDVFAPPLSPAGSEKSLAGVFAHWYVASYVDTPGAVAVETPVADVAPQVPVVTHIDKTVQAFSVTISPPGPQNTGTWIVQNFPEAFPAGSTIEVVGTAAEETGIDISEGTARPFVNIRNITTTNFEYYLTDLNGFLVANGESLRVSFIAKRTT